MICIQCNRNKKSHLYPKGKDICKRCTKKNSVTRIQEMNTMEFHKYKASQLRTNWRARGKKLGVDLDSVPSTTDIRRWLDNNVPYTCYFTNMRLDRYFGVDHLTPIARGGSFYFNNLVLTTPILNSAKGDMNGNEFIHLLRLTKDWEDGGADLLKRLRSSNNQFRR